MTCYTHHLSLRYSYAGANRWSGNIDSPLEIGVNSVSDAWYFIQLQGSLTLQGITGSNGGQDPHLQAFIRVLNLDAGGGVIASTGSYVNDFRKTCSFPFSLLGQHYVPKGRASKVGIQLYTRDGTKLLLEFQAGPRDGHLIQAPAITALQFAGEAPPVSATNDLSVRVSREAEDDVIDVT